MPIKVFISHKDSDSELAERVARRVRFNGMDTYLDTIDDALAKDGPDLAELLVARMSSCQQLIAVVSSQTKDSWWVPWEIGVGSEKASGWRVIPSSTSPFRAISRSGRRCTATGTWTSIASTRSRLQFGWHARWTRSTATSAGSESASRMRMSSIVNSKQCSSKGSRTDTSPAHQRGKHLNGQEEGLHQLRLRPR